MSDGLLLPDEVTPALERAASKMAKANQQGDRQRKKKRLVYIAESKTASAEEIFSLGQVQGLQGPVWLDPRLGTHTQAVQRKLHTLGVTSHSQARTV